jgi:hypothetical protein
MILDYFYISLLDDYTQCTRDIDLFLSCCRIVIGGGVRQRFVGCERTFLIEGHGSKVEHSLVRRRPEAM